MTLKMGEARSREEGEPEDLASSHCLEHNLSFTPIHTIAVTPELAYDSILSHYQWFG